MEDITYTRDLTERGYPPEEIARLVRSGELIRIRRGAYLTKPDRGVADVRAAHLLMVRATIAQYPALGVVSHMSAAVIHGLPLWSEWLERVHVTQNRKGGGKARRLVQVHGTPIEPDEITVVDGVVVTSPARTVLDLACVLPMQSGVAIGDAALRLGMQSTELEDLIGRAGPRTGIAAARRTIALLDAKSESVGESRSRVLFHQHGIPAPVPQFEVADASGWVFARTDFGWPELRTVGEFDGKVKYRRDLRPGHDPERELFAEKRREDRIREQDLQVVRWVTADIERPADLFARLERAFARGSRLP